MSKSNVPEVITKSARSLAAHKRWEKKRMQDPIMNKKSNWFKEHADTIAIVCAIAIGVWTMKNDIHSVELRLSKEIYNVRLDLSKEISGVKSDVDKVGSEVDKIKMIMIIKELVPKEAFARNDEITL